MSRETWRAQWDKGRTRTVVTEGDGQLDEVVLMRGRERVFHVERMGANDWCVWLGDSVMLTVGRVGGEWRVHHVEGTLVNE